MPDYEFNYHLIINYHLINITLKMSIIILLQSLITLIIIAITPGN